jgi:hypothetical protein
MGRKYFQEFHENVAKWIADGSLKIKMSETKGIDNAPEGFIGMLKGDNFGKAILVIDELESVSIRVRYRELNSVLNASSETANTLLL